MRLTFDSSSLNVSDGPSSSICTAVFDLSSPLFVSFSSENWNIRIYKMQIGMLRMNDKLSNCPQSQRQEQKKIKYKINSGNSIVCSTYRY